MLDLPLREIFKEGGRMNQKDYKKVAEMVWDRNKLLSLEPSLENEKSIYELGQQIKDSQEELYHQWLQHTGYENSEDNLNYWFSNVFEKERLLVWKEKGEPI